MNPFVKIGPFEKVAIIGVFLSVILLSWFFSIVNGGGQIYTTLGITSYLLVFCLPFLIKRDLGWFHPLVFMVMWWGFARYLLPRTGVVFSGLSEHRLAPFANIQDLNIIAAAGFSLSAIGVFSFYIGYVIRDPKTVHLTDRQYPRFVAAKALGVFLLSVSALLILVREAGGLSELLLQRGVRSDLRIDNELGGEHWHYFAGLGVTASLVWLSIDHRVWKRAVFILVFLGALAIQFAATGSRSNVILPIIMAGAIWALKERRVPYLGATSAIILSLLIIGVGGQFRELSRSADSLQDINLNLSVADQIYRGISNMTDYATDKDGFYGILLRVPHDVDLLYGRSYLSIPVAPIPSVMLPFEKPPAGGKLNSATIFENPYSAVPPGNIGEAFWNFHIPGIILVMAIFGFVMRVVSNFYRDNCNSPFSVVIFVFTLFYLQPNSSSIYDWLHKIVPAVVLYVFFAGLPRLSYYHARKDSVGVKPA